MWCDSGDGEVVCCLCKLSYKIESYKLESEDNKQKKVWFYFGGVVGGDFDYCYINGGNFR